MTTEHKCGECAKFKVSDAGCPNYAYFHEYVDGRPLMDANATACSDFLEKGSYELGDYVFKIKGDLVLIYEGAEPRYPIKISALDSLMNRKALAKSLNLEQDEIDRLAAKILANYEATANEKVGQLKSKLPTPSDAEKDKILDGEASALLRDPKFLFRIKEDMDRTIKGENENKLLMWLLEVSARTKDYTFVDALGESAVGKSNLMRETLRYVPSEWWRKVGRMTRTAIDYLKDQNFCLLWIQEARGAGEAAPSIRLQSGDDGGLTIWTTERDEETGRFTTNEYSVPGRGVITTTTNVSFSPEDSTRTWMISVDASDAQTKRIIGYKLEKAKEPSELLAALGRKSADLAPTIQRALLMLDWDSPVIIPYADDLASLFSPRLVRARRDVDKFLGLVKVIVRLHQHQRPMPEINGKRFIVATAQDAIIAFQLGSKPLEETLTGLEKRLREVYETLGELGNATSTQIGVKIRKGSEYARRVLRVLVEMGYVDVDESQKTHIYSVRQTENPSNDLQGLQRTLSGSELQKKVDSFLLDISSQPPADGGDSEIGWKKGYFDPISGIWVELETVTPHPPEVERRSEFDLNPSVTEENVLGWLRRDWKGGTEAEFDELLKSQGYAAEQAPRLRQKWLNQGLLRVHSGSLVLIGGEVEKGPGQRLSIQEIFELLHNELPKGREFTEQQFLDCVVKHGWTREDHDVFFRKLVDEGNLLVTPEGGYVWV